MSARGNMEFVEIDRPHIGVRGFITVSLKNGKHFTYRVQKFSRTSDRMVVGLLRGPDNYADYVNFGFVDPPAGTPKGEQADPASYVVKLWYRYNGTMFEKHAQLLMGQAQQHVVSWMQSSQCRKCGRLLTDPESIQRGLGPKCAGVA